MAYNPNNTNGQKTMANSSPVVIASDQSAVAISTISTSVTPGTASANLGKAEDAAAVSGDTGVMMLGVRADAVTTATSADGDYSQISVDRAGNVQTVPGRATTATLSNVTSAATNTSLLAANSARKAVILYNDSTSVLFLKYGSTATTTSFTYYLSAGATWEMPSPIFTGALDGIWQSANGAARITELTA